MKQVFLKFLKLKTNIYSITRSMGGFFSFVSNLRQACTPENWSCGSELEMFCEEGRKNLLERQRERGREGGRKGERKRETEGGREGGRERGREGGRKKERERLTATILGRESGMTLWISCRGLSPGSPCRFLLLNICSSFLAWGQVRECGLGGTTTY